MKSLRIISITLTLLAAASCARAQFAPPLSLSSSPASPAPRGNFTVSASTPTFDATAAFFEWTVDGRARPELSGLGAHEITLTAGNIGFPTRVSVTVTPSQGTGATASTSIIPSELTVLWSADTSVPRWYRGKALVTPGAAVIVSALPRITLSGVEINPDSLIYRWRVDSSRVALAGAGRRTFRFTASQSPDTTHQVDLTIEDVDGRIRKDGQILIENNAVPKIVLYASSPLGGIAQGTGGGTRGRPGLYDIVAEPYFFPLTSLSSLTYEWAADGTPIGSAPGTPNVITVNANNITNQNISVSAIARASTPVYISRTGLFNLFITAP